MSSSSSSSVTCELCGPVGDRKAARKAGKRKYRMLCVVYLLAAAAESLLVVPSLRTIAFCVTTAIFTLAFFTYVPQIPALPGNEEHFYADKRPFLLPCACVPNGMDVFTNLPFAGVGLWGITRLSDTIDLHATSPVAWWSYLCFNLGVCLVCLGSAYYHLKPCNRTLSFDRAPIAMIITSYTFAQVAESTGVKNVVFGVLGLLLANLLAGASVLNFLWNEEVRGYYFVQYGQLAICLANYMLLPMPAGRSTWLLVASGALYVVAKVLEEGFDAKVFNWTGRVISGHSLKHLLMAVSLLLVNVMVVSPPVAS